MTVIDKFWQDFLSQANLPNHTKYFEASHFDITKESANNLLQLVLAGQKRATASSLPAYQREGVTPPKVGDYSIITDWDGVPHCVIQTTAVTILPFNQFTFDIIKREGEDDCLETWQENHEHVFRIEGQELGYEFAEDMPVIFEDFEVVYKK